MKAKLSGHDSTRYFTQAVEERVFSNKVNNNGMIAKPKATNVAKRFSQVESVACSQTAATTPFLLHPSRW